MRARAFIVDLTANSGMHGGCGICKVLFGMGAALFKKSLAFGYEVYNITEFITFIRTRHANISSFLIHMS